MNDTLAPRPAYCPRCKHDGAWYLIAGHWTHTGDETACGYRTATEGN